jgi:pSer/pThr/pTyr-binding forkhead associated (FHA) protein
MNLILNVRGSTDEIVFDAQTITEIIIGRLDPETGETPAIDLERFHAMEQGVSRRHAAIVRKEGGSLQIVDKGSPNGTFLNGQRLIANQPRILRDGDELRLGKLVLSVHFRRE